LKREKDGIPAGKISYVLQPKLSNPDFVFSTCLGLSFYAMILLLEEQDENACL